VAVAGHEGHHLQVSPAPGAATFGDVPTGHPFFQFVEALAASGITAGCGNGNFCPDAPLTRGQMAVFLSKALGLHWPVESGTNEEARRGDPHRIQTVFRRRLTCTR
jgi:S-layer homology domain